MGSFNCNHCNFSSPYKYNLARHLREVHHATSNEPRQEENFQTTGEQSILQTNNKELKEQAMKNYEDYIQKLENALQCQQKRNDDEVQQLLKYQQHKHDQELKEQQCTLQKQFNIKITNIQNQNTIEKENLCKEYQHCINQNGVQYQKELENEIGKVCKEYLCCIDQWKQALECKQNQYDKMKELKDDLQKCINEYVEAENKTKGKYHCEVCGVRMKTNLKLLMHMKKHR